MKTYFEEPALRLLTFAPRDILTASLPGSGDPDELPFIPVTNP